MKLASREAPGYFARPDPGKTGLLIYGPDGMRVALKRQEVIAALVGPRGEEEMRLTRLAAGDLRKDPAQLLDAVKAQGFFPGPRVVFVEDATDQIAGAVTEAMQSWAEGDAQIIVTAGQLKPASKLRKLFEGHRTAYAAAIYDDPPSRDEIEAMLAKAGLRNVDRDAMTGLIALARELDPGDFRQTLEKLSLYKLEDREPVSPADLAACAPGSTEAALDDALNIVAEARAGEVGPVLGRLGAQGVQPVGLCIAAMRHFKALYTVASDPGGVSQGIARLRPPVFGPRRDRMQKQAQSWGAARLEQALTMLTDTDLQLRSAGQRAPEMALVERVFIRLAMLGRR